MSESYTLPESVFVVAKEIYRCNVNNLLRHYGLECKEAKSIIEEDFMAYCEKKANEGEPIISRTNKHTARRWVTALYISRRALLF